MRTLKFTLIIISFFFIQNSYSQSLDSLKFVEKTKFTGRIFTNFMTGLNRDVNSFNVTRAYLGLESQIAPNYKVILKLDIGSPEDLSEFSRIKRYAFFKNAGLVYSKDALTLSFGIIDMYQFKIQEKFWGHRYLYKSFMDEHRFGTSADIGGRIEYRVKHWLATDLTVSNGEGYAKLQIDNSFKTGFGAIIAPGKHLRVRLYYDFMNKNEITQSTVSFFTGLTVQKMKIGGDINLVINSKNETSQNLWGYSFYSMYAFNRKWEIFARFDILTSSKIESEDYGWNYSRDGTAFIGGIQFRPIPKIKIALDYQDWYPYPPNLSNVALFYVHFEFNI